MLEKYTDGINTCVRERSLTWEMHLLGIKWEEWKPSDSIGMFKLISFLLAFDYKFEVLREKIADTFGEEKARLFLGG